MIKDLFLAILTNLIFFSLLLLYAIAYCLFLTNLSFEEIDFSYLLASIGISVSGVSLAVVFLVFFVLNRK